jgi:hypothetical protein
MTLVVEFSGVESTGCRYLQKSRKTIFFFDSGCELNTVKFQSKKNIVFLLFCKYLHPVDSTPENSTTKVMLQMLLHMLHQ